MNTSLTALPSALEVSELYGSSKEQLNRILRINGFKKNQLGLQKSLPRYQHIITATVSDHRPGENLEDIAEKAEIEIRWSLRLNSPNQVWSVLRTALEMGESLAYRLRDGSYHVLEYKKEEKPSLVA